MSAGFKNALCLELPPEHGAGFADSYWFRCHRHTDHPMPHRSKHWEWNDGDKESRRRVPAQPTPVKEG